MLHAAGVSVAPDPAHFPAVNDAVDADSDGAGEYGSFGEMSGVTALNVRSGVGVAAPMDPPSWRRRFRWSIPRVAHRRAAITS